MVQERKNKKIKSMIKRKKFKECKRDGVVSEKTLLIRSTVDRKFGFLCFLTWLNKSKVSKICCSLRTCTLIKLTSF